MFTFWGFSVVFPPEGNGISEPFDTDAAVIEGAVQNDIAVISEDVKIKASSDPEQ